MHIIKAVPQKLNPRARLQKGDTVRFHLYQVQEQAKLIYGDGGQSNGQGLNEESIRELPEVVEMFYMVSGVVVKQMNKSVRTQGTG